jgi:hypothetical protein
VGVAVGDRPDTDGAAPGQRHAGDAKAARVVRPGVAIDQSGDAVALHFSGRFLEGNYGVPAETVARIVRDYGRPESPRSARPVAAPPRDLQPALLGLIDDAQHVAGLLDAKRRRGFIQDQHIGAKMDGARNRQCLTLARDSCAGARIRRHVKLLKGGGGDADTDTDADTDSDADADTDADTDTLPKDCIPEKVCQFTAEAAQSAFSASSDSMTA